MPERMQIDADSPLYPGLLRARLGGDAPAALTAWGNAALLHLPLVALFCSERAPPVVTERAVALVRDLRAAGVPVVSGFQSPVERACLEALLRGTQPLVVCPARDLARMRLPRPLRPAMEDGRLLLLSACRGRRRPDARLAEARNRLAAALAERVVVAYATPGGRLHRLAVEVVDRGQPLLCLPDPLNPDLLLLGARPLLAHPAPG